MPTLGDDPEVMVCFIQNSMMVINTVVLDFPGGVVDRNLSANAGGHGFDPWSGKIPHVGSNYAHVPQLLSRQSRACRPQLLSPHATSTKT